jgi:hypothetical protein
MTADAPVGTMTLNDTVKIFESLFSEVVAGLSQRYSQTGEEYTEIFNWGPRREGESAQLQDFATGKIVLGLTIHATESDALSQWLKEATAFAAPLLTIGAKLYWRTMPETDYGHVDIYATNGLFRVPTWKVYSRLLISDKPRKGI